MHELTTAVAVAPVEMAQRTCGEVADELAGLSCDTEYSRLSMSAALCCGGGASYCPAPTLCADDDPAAVFNPAAVHEYLCYSMLSAEFAAENCSAAGCHPSHHDGQGSCSCPSVTDSEACLDKLPGELSRACVLCARSMDA